MRFVKAVTALLLVVCALFAAAPARAEVAVIEVARVIDESAPGKAGQKYVDGLLAHLNAEFERFKQKNAKAKNAAQLAAQKQAELNAEYGREHARVTALVMDALRKCAQDWLKVNKKGVTLIVPANSALAYSAKIDVSNEILKKLNAVTIDFTARR